MRSKILATAIVTAVLLTACGERSSVSVAERFAETGNLGQEDGAGVSDSGENAGLPGGPQGQGMGLPEASGPESAGAPGTAGVAGTGLSDASGTGGAAAEVVARQEGSAGTLQVTLPEGWVYESCPEGSGSLLHGDYGIHFYPENVSEGLIELCYTEFFGVCGTGLDEERINLAGDEANVGVYDGHDYWNFVSFRGTNKGIVALAFEVKDWQQEYVQQALEILDTVRLTQETTDGSEKTGSGEAGGISGSGSGETGGIPGTGSGETGEISGTGSGEAGNAPGTHSGEICGYPPAPGSERPSGVSGNYNYVVCGVNEEPSGDESQERGREDSRIEELGLSLEIENSTSTEATLVFRQRGGNPSGEILTGDAFSIERYENGDWVEVPVAVEGNYAFHEVAYTISGDRDSEFQVGWEWLYGKLEPGEYRIEKSVDDFRKTADYDQYRIYGYFRVTL